MAKSVLIGVTAALVVLSWPLQNVQAEAWAIPEEERAALMALFEATGPSEELIIRGWGGEPGTECSWIGVHCSWDDPNRVWALYVWGLSGALPDLSELVGLRHLDLTNNQVELVPADQWPPNLTSLNLQGNQLTELDTARLPPGLEALDASGNQLATLDPDWITALSDAGLRELDLSHNRLTGELPALPAGLGLRQLDLSQNDFRGAVPASWKLMAELEGLVITDNRLDGELPNPEPGDWPLLHRLDLSNNRLTGTIPPGIGNLTTLERLDLSRNDLSGSLPPELGQAASLDRIRLAHNRLAGQLPETLGQLSLRQLDLANNHFEGDLSPAFMALWPTFSSLDVSGNRFSGELPQLVLEINFGYPADEGGSLNLCFNDLSIPDEALANFVAAHHVGGAPDDCLGRQRSAMNTHFSGSWFVHGREGEGFSVQLTDQDQLLAYWFGYDLDGTQRWFYGNDLVGEHWASLRQIWTMQGRFGEGLSLMVSAFLDEGFVEAPIRQLLRFHPLEPERALVERPQARSALCLFPTMFPNCRGGALSWQEREVLRLEHQQFTRLAGARCSQQQPLQWVSGAWYDPSRYGEGFLVEVNEDGRGLVYWFTYTPDDTGQQAWMIGEGHFEGQSLIIEQLLQPLSDELGPAFEPVNVELVDWGRLELHFDDDLGGLAIFDSHLAEFGSGDFPLARLARPKLADCSVD